LTHQLVEYVLGSCLELALDQILDSFAWDSLVSLLLVILGSHNNFGLFFLLLLLLLGHNNILLES